MSIAVILLAWTVFALAFTLYVLWQKMGALDATLATHEIRCRRLEDEVNLNVVRGKESFDRMLAECEQRNLLKSEKELEEERK